MINSSILLAQGLSLMMEGSTTPVQRSKTIVDNMLCINSLSGQLYYTWFDKAMP